MSRGPDDLIMFGCDDRAAQPVGVVGVDPDGSAGKGVFCYTDELPHGGVDAEFFLQFARQALCMCFALFDGSSWEFPFSGETIIGAALSDKDGIVDRNYPCNHIDLSSHHGRTILQANGRFNLMRIWDA